MKTWRENRILRIKNWPWLLLFVLLSLGQLQRIQLPNNWAIYLHDFVLVGWLGWALVFSKKAAKHRQLLTAFFQKLSQNKVLRLTLFWVLASTVVGSLWGRVTLTSWLYLARLALYLLFVVWLKLSPQKPSFPRIAGFIMVGLWIGLFGILQYLFLPDTRFLHIFGWDNHYYRLISTHLDPGFTGMMLVLSLGALFQFVLAFKENKPLWKSPLFLFLSLFLTSSIALTFSRSSYLALAVLLGGLTLIYKKQRVFFIALGFFFLSLLPFIPKPGGAGVDLDRTETLQFRVINSQQGIRALEGTQWLYGRGVFNSDAFQVSHTHHHAQIPDNLIVTVLNGTGLGGLILLALLTWKFGRKTWQKNPLWVILFLATLTHSLFNNTFLQPFVFLMLWGIWGTDVKKTSSES